MWLKRCCESEQIIRKHPSGSAANCHAHDHSVCAQCPLAPIFLRLDVRAVTCQCPGPGSWQAVYYAVPTPQTTCCGPLARNGNRIGIKINIEFYRISDRITGIRRGSLAAHSVTLTVYRQITDSPSDTARSCIALLHRRLAPRRRRVEPSARQSPGAAVRRASLSLGFAPYRMNLTLTFENVRR